MINETFEIDFENDEVKLTNMGAAAALYSLGWDFLRLAPTDRMGQRQFVFRRSPPDYLKSEYPPAEGIYNDFRHNRLGVDAQRMWDAGVAIKSFVMQDYVPQEKMLRRNWKKFSPEQKAEAQE